MQRVWSFTRAQTFPDKKPAPPPSPVSILTSLVDSTEILPLAERWKLSKREKMLGSFLAQNREKVMQDRTSLKYYQDFLISNVDREYVLELARYRNHMDHFLALKDWVVPVMPVNGKDLIAAGVAKGEKFKFRLLLESLKKRWMESGFEMSKDELLEFVDKETSEDKTEEGQDSKKRKTS